MSVTTVRSPTTLSSPTAPVAFPDAPLIVVSEPPSRVAEDVLPGDRRNARIQPQSLSRTPPVDPATDGSTTQPDDAAPGQAVQHVSTAAFLDDVDADPDAAHVDDACVAFLAPRLTARSRGLIRRLAKFARRPGAQLIVVVTSPGRHLRDPRATALAAFLEESLPQSVTVIHTGLILSAGSRAARFCRRFRLLRGLVHPRLRSTFVLPEELAGVIATELIDQRQSAQPRIPGIRGPRVITLLGERRSWRSVMEPSAPDAAPIAALASAVSLIGRCGPALVGLGLSRLLAKLVPGFRAAQVETLRPESVRELLSLVNQHNWHHLQLAGYNNGVNHFGWQFPKQTVVLTTGAGERMRIAGDRIRADAGVTLHACIHALREQDREFPVIPNYSWIALGTTFFVPVHGSGSEVSTLGDAIDEVLLFDGRSEQLIRARRGQPEFDDAMYAPHPWRLLLRLRLRTIPQARYSVRNTTLIDANADQILDAFDDPEASHVEVRKNQAAGRETQVRHYFVNADPDQEGLLDAPRDAIGRVWDRLEETPGVSFLFHWFVRRFAWHVELFLTEAEFRTFWDHHATLPVSKIQVRRLLRDGMPHSACRDHDCYSADLFMTRGTRDVFCAFVAQHLPDVRCNPGKQSL